VAVGCEECGDGYRGRAAVWDFFPLDRDLRRALAAGATEADLREQKAAQGWPSLAASGLELVRQGRTTLEELVREISLS
jgi:protein transport protein HofB